MDTLRHLTIASVVATLLAVLGITLWEVAPYNASPLPHESGWLGFPAWSLFGLALFVSFVTLAVDLVNQCMTHYHQKAWQDFLCGRTEGKTRYVWISVVVQGVMARIYVLLAITVGVTWSWDVVRCGIFFCTGDPSKYTADPDKKAYKGDIINTVMGLFLLFTFLPMGAVLIVRILFLTVKLRRLQKIMKEAATAEDVTVIDATADDSAAPAAASASERTSNTARAATVVPPISPVLAAASAPAITSDTATTTTAAAAANPAANSNVVPSEEGESMRFYVSPPTSRQAITFGLTLLALIVCMLMGYYYPNDLHRLTAKKVAEFAAETVSIDGIKNTTSSVPELPSAIFRTRVWSWSATLRFKTFPGNCFLYTYLILVLVIVWGLRQSQKGRHWMQRRVSFFPALNYVEAGLAAGAALLTLLFFIYWAHDHNFKSVWTSSVDTSTTHFPTREVFARAMGQVAALFLSLLLLPVSRHSVLHNLLGTSWESFLFAHRFLGYAFLVAMIVHALSYYSVFSLYGQFWSNLFSLPPSIGYRKVTGDFTVVLMEWWLGPLVVVCMGVGAYWKVRRQFFEIFYYAHLFASYSILGIVLLHAPSSWQYMLPGLTLWFVDRLIRLFQRSALVDLGEARIISEDVCEIGFRVRSGVGNVMQTASPGHYVFLNVAEISALQWHPFTLSSVAGGGATSASAPYTVHVKSMGPGTWTQRLYERVARGEPLTLAVEGPCGSPLDVSQYEELYLVCGGIGVTPCASIFGSVLRWARAQSQGGMLDGAETRVVLPRRVKLIWACRSAQLVQAMAPSLGLPSYLFREGTAGDACRAEASALPSTQTQDISFEVSLSITDTTELATLNNLIAAAENALATAPSVLVREPEVQEEESADLDSALPESAPPSVPFTSLPEAASSAEKPPHQKSAPPTATTTSKSSSSPVKLSEIRSSRPSLLDELRPTTDPVKCMVMVCGPATLVEDTIKACVALELPVRAEEFEL